MTSKRTANRGQMASLSIFHNEAPLFIPDQGKPRPLKWSRLKRTDEIEVSPLQPALRNFFNAGDVSTLTELDDFTLEVGRGVQRSTIGSTAARGAFADVFGRDFSGKAPVVKDDHWSASDIPALYSYGKTTLSSFNYPVNDRDGKAVWCWLGDDLHWAHSEEKGQLQGVEDPLDSRFSAVTLFKPDVFTRYWPPFGAFDIALRSFPVLSALTILLDAQPSATQREALILVAWGFLDLGQYLANERLERVHGAKIERGVSSSGGTKRGAATANAAKDDSIERRRKALLVLVGRHRADKPLQAELTFQQIRSYLSKRLPKSREEAYALGLNWRFFNEETAGTEVFSDGKIEADLRWLDEQGQLGLRIKRKPSQA